MQTQNLYNTDFNAWVYNSIDSLKSRRFDDLDIESLIEEMEGLAARNRRELFNRLVILLAHLIKWQYQSNLRCGSWKGTITVQRMGLEDLLEESPSLKNKFTELLLDKRLFRRVLDIVIKDTEIYENNLPKENPFTAKEILNNEFFPNG